MNSTLSEGQKKVLSDAREIISEVKKVIIGKDEVIIKALLTILSKGHILIEDIPGVGKTTLALALSKAMSIKYKRLQFTPDVLPSDVTGFTVYNKESGRFDYKEGAAMCNLFLADEINRTSSKTQSALLEIMEEGKITVDGVTRNAPEPYIVIATQNPVGSIGTQLLPESQLDRFMIRMTIGYPDTSSEVMMLKTKQGENPLDYVKSVVTAEDVNFAREIVEEIYISDKILEYIASLAKATREHPMIKLGLSPRGTIALSRITKATALLKGRNYAVPDDVQYAFHDVVEHRIILNSKTRVNSISGAQILDEILSTVPVPKVGKAAII